MGCDIHYLVEGYRADTRTWEWAKWDKVKAKSYEPGADRYVSILDSLINNRNYSLFFLLADVREWKVDGDVPVPIAPNRGIPHNASPQETYLGDHGFTFLDKYDMNRIRASRAYFSACDGMAVYHVLERILGHGWFLTRCVDPEYLEYRILIGFDS